MSDDAIVVTDDRTVVVSQPDQSILIVEIPPTEAEPPEAPAPVVQFVTTDQPSTVVVSQTGVAGPPGATGPTGPSGSVGAQGPPGAAGGTYIHYQGVPSDTWEIPHNLNFYPAGIKVKDSGGTLIDAMRVHYVDLNNLTLKFFVGMQPVPFSGEAYLS